MIWSRSGQKKEIDIHCQQSLRHPRLNRMHLPNNLKYPLIYTQLRLKEKEKASETDRCKEKGRTKGKDKEISKLKEEKKKRKFSGQEIYLS